MGNDMEKVIFQIDCSDSDENGMKGQSGSWGDQLRDSVI